MYESILSAEARKFYEQAQSPLRKKLFRCFESLGGNPLFGPNIKPLRGALKTCIDIEF